MVLLPSARAVKRRPLFRQVGYNLWSENKPSPREGHAMATGPDGSIYMFGGEDGSLSGELFKLDTDEGIWTSIGEGAGMTPTAGSGQRMTAVGGDLYVFGGGRGFGTASTGYSGELFKFSTVTMTWTRLGTGPSARHGHGIATVGEDFYVFGGGDYSGESQGVEGQIGHAWWSCCVCHLSAGVEVVEPCACSSFMHGVECECYAARKAGCVQGTAWCMRRRWVR